MGTLYVVSVSPGNRRDVTLRALRVLRQVSLIVSQDMPRAQAFLAYCGIDAPLACYAGDETRGQCRQGSEFVLEALMGGDVALLFEVEAEAASHSAHHLVRAAAKRGITVVSVPGPSAAVMALVASGLPSNAYVSIGFLPQRAFERRQLLVSLAAERRTLVAFETSGRLLVALHDVATALGDRPLALSPLWLKSDEEMWRGRTNEAVAHFETSLPHGDWTLVIGGATEEAVRWPEERVRSELARLLAEGVRRKEAARQVAEAAGWRPREVYRLAIPDNSNSHFGIET